jgi:hypothetical protein
MLISDFIKRHLPLVLSLGLFGASAYLVYQYRNQLPSLARIYTRTNKNKLDDGL